MSAEITFDGMTAEEAVKAMASFLTSGSGQTLTLRAQAISLQQQAAQLLDQADAVEFAEQLKAAAASLADPVAEAFAVEQAAEEAVTEAIAEERLAEDRHREAIEHQRQAAELERLAQKRHAPAGEQAQMLSLARAAVDVTARQAAAAEGARAARQQAEKRLTEARAAARIAEDAQEAAFKLAQNPPAAPVSQSTVLLDGLRRLMAGQEMTGAAHATAAFLVGELAKSLRIHNGWIAQGRDLVEQELKQRSTAFLPPAGSSARPRTVGVDVIPVVPTR